MDKDAVDKIDSPFTSTANVVDDMREVLGAMVAGLKADGFTDEQARDIIAGFWRSTGRETTDGK